MELKERDVETGIDKLLNNKKWIDDIKNPERTVYKQGVKIESQYKALGGKSPDYTLYQEKTNIPLIVIEAKRPHVNLHNAMEQAIDYAKRINAPMAFVTDGIFTKTYHLEKAKPLYLNGEEVDDLIEHSIAINYLHDNEYNTIDKKVIKSREELISIFKSLNDSFRDAGVRNGVERTELFCNILFLKVISEMSSMEGALTSPVEEVYRWDNFKNKKGLELLDFINKQAFDYFKKSYGGDVLSQIPQLVNPNILNTVVDKLNDLSLSDTNTDIKGDAFEYFLRNYGGADTDFGEYFTPRHIVKTLVKLLNPQFGEKIYDPFCGTGGMLITAFKHVYDRMPRNIDTINTLKSHTVYGGELTSMARVAKMNMILAGDGHSNIIRGDSYAIPQTDKYDVVITNIPFGKKSKTKFSGLYGYSTESAEVTGVLHCLDALNDSENARAGIIVPYGVLFTEDRAYTALREQLIDKCELKSIVELHNYTFAPNTNVNARMLIVKKRKNAKQKHIWYFPIINDGFSKDTARRKLQGNNDIDTLLGETELTVENKDRLKELNFTTLDVTAVRNNKYIIVPARYETRINSVTNKYPIVKLGDIITYETGSRPKGGVGGVESGAISIGGTHINDDGYVDLKKIAYVPLDFYQKATRGKVNNYDILLCKDGAKTGKTAIIENLPQKEIMINEHVYLIRGIENKINQYYLFFCLHSSSMFTKIQKLSKKTAQEGLTQSILKNLEIPLPSLEEQLKIVSELKTIHQSIKQAERLIESLKTKGGGTFNLFWNEESRLVKIGDVCEYIYAGGDVPKENFSISKTNDYTIPIFSNGVGENALYGFTNIPKISKPCVTVSARGTIGFATPRNEPFYPIVRLLVLIPKYYMDYRYLAIAINNIKLSNTGSTIPQLTIPNISNCIIEVPSLQMQQKIVADLEQDLLFIKQTELLINRQKQKINNMLNFLWQNI